MELAQIPCWFIVLIPIMGCNSSQVHVATPDPIGPGHHQELQSSIIIVQNKAEEQPQSARSTLPKNPSKQRIEKEFKQWCFLFGQTETQRKIVCFDTKQYQFSTISSRTKIPQPVLKCLPIEVIYQQSQELFSSALFSNNSHPPYNFMLALWLDSTRIFLCGGITVDFRHISSESFVFDTSLQTLSNHRLGNNLMGSRLQKLPFMPTKRYSHMGVVYTTGLLKYVYIFGGRGTDNQLLSECSKYSVVQKKWTKIAPMKVARSTGFAFVYRSRIYVCGGYSGKPKRTKKIEVYHPDEDYWQVLNVKMHRGLQTGLLFSVNPNELLFIGGNLEYGSVNSMVKVNLEEQTYIAAGEMKYPRVLEKGCLTNRQIIVFGGTFCDGLEIYDYKEEQWRENPSSFGAHITTEEINSFSYSMETVEVEYEETIQQSKPHSDLSDARALIFSHDSCPFILDVNFTHSIITKRAVPMSLRLRSYMGCILIKPGKYFICGGVSQFYEKSTRSTYIYYSGSNHCIEQSKMSTGRYKFSICIYKNEVYVFGGKSMQEQESLWQCEKFNLETNTWSEIGALNIGRHSAVAVPINNKIYIAGGSNGARQLEEVEVYNPQNNTMVLLQTCIRLIPQMMSTSIGDEIYVFGKNLQSVYRVEVLKSTGPRKIQIEKVECIEGENPNQYHSEKPVIEEQQKEQNQTLKQKSQELPEQTQQKIEDDQKPQDTVEQKQPQKPEDPLQQENLIAPKEKQDADRQPGLKVQGVVSSSQIEMQWEQLTLHQVTQLPPDIVLSVCDGSSIYLFTSTCKIYHWDGKHFVQKTLVNQPLLGEVDWARVSIG